MNEWQPPEEDQDPEPIKHADAQRITEDEAQRVPTSDGEQPGDGSSDPGTETD